MSRPRKKINEQISEQTNNTVKDSGFVFTYTKYMKNSVKLDTIVSREYLEGWATCDKLYVLYNSPAWEVLIMKNEKRNDEYDYKELIELTDSIAKVTGC